MALSFAYIDQAWNNDTNKKRNNQKTSRSSKTKIYDDIIDTYLDDKKQIMTAEEYDNNCGTVPLASQGSLYDNALDYDRFFENTNMFQAKEKIPSSAANVDRLIDTERQYEENYNETDTCDEQENIIEEEELLTSNTNLNDNEVTDLFDDGRTFKYSNEKTIKQSNLQSILELGLFIFSGIILIFILEQFVQLGVHMK